jgi:hypothetical protein
MAWKTQEKSIMSDYKKQHYIPQFLLKRFSLAREHNNRKNESIYRLEKEKHEIKEKGIKNCAYENYYYSFLNNDGSHNPFLENAFSIFENLASSVLDKIDQRIDIYKRSKLVFGIDDKDK